MGKYGDYYSKQCRELKEPLEIGVDLASGPDRTAYHHLVECNAGSETPFGEGICICKRALRRSVAQEK